MPEAVPVAVVGAGWWSNHAHLPALVEHPHARLVGVVDPNREKGEAAALRWGTKAFASLDELVAADRPAGVVIAVPHSAHAVAAGAALDAGLGVLLEKPMTLDPADAWDLVERAERGGQVLMIGYTYQFTRHAVAAREAVASGRLGDVSLVAITYTTGGADLFRGDRGGLPGPQPPDPATYDDPAVSGGGHLQTQATHGVAMMLSVLDQSVDSVTCHMHNAGAAVDVVDAAAFRLSGGTVGTLTATAAVAPGQPSRVGIDYYGSKAMMQHELVSGRVVVHGADGRVDVLCSGDPPEPPPAAEPVNRFVAMLRGDAVENPAPGALGARAVEFVAGAYR